MEQRARVQRSDMRCRRHSVTQRCQSASPDRSDRPAPVALHRSLAGSRRQNRHNPSNPTQARLADLPPLPRQRRFSETDDRARLPHRLPFSGTQMSDSQNSTASTRRLPRRSRERDDDSRLDALLDRIHQLTTRANAASDDPAATPVEPLQPRRPDAPRCRRAQLSRARRLGARSSPTPSPPPASPTAKSKR